MLIARYNRTELARAGHHVVTHAGRVGIVVQVQERRCPERDDEIYVWFPSGVPSELERYETHDDGIAEDVVAVPRGDLGSMTRLITPHVSKSEESCTCDAHRLLSGTLDVDPFADTELVEEPPPAVAR